MGLLKELKFYSGLAIKAIPFLRFYSGQMFYWFKKGKFKNAYHYFWTIAFTKEDGAALLEWRYRKNPDKTPYPGRIEVETTTVCPLKCQKCEHTFWNEKQKNMTYEQFVHILKQFPKLKAISCSGIGHGFNNPDFPKMLKYLKSRQIFTQFFDPFLIINEERAKLLVKLGVEKIWVSFDGATKEAYEKVQEGSNFDRAIENLKRIVKIKKQMKSKFPELAFHMIITKDNYKEIPDIIDKIHEITKGGNKLNVVQFTKLIPFKENEGIRPPKIPKKLINEAFKRAKKYGNFRLSFCNVGKKLPIEECTAWTVPFMTVNGEYYQCCAFTEGNVRDKIRKFLIGNLFKQHFKDIWHSKEMRKFIRDIHNKKIPPICTFRDCPMFECRPKK